MNETKTLPAMVGGFQLQVKSFEEGWRMADMISQSSLCPKAYAGKAGDCMVAMLMGAEIGLNPIQSLQNIATINGKPSLYGDACLALVMQHPQFGGIGETYDEEAQKATCVLSRGNQTVTRTFSKANAEKAQLWGKAGPWQTYPDRMLQMRARSRAIRDLFPDALAGLSVAEEAADMGEIEIVGEVAPADAAITNATGLNSQLLGKPDQPQPETEKAAEIENKEVSEPPAKTEKVVTYAEIRDQIEKCDDLNKLVEIVADVSGMHHLGKTQIKELKDAAGNRHKALTAA